jgi:hypothetical protein
MADVAVLQYGNNEHSILYKSTDWRDLLRLLMDPVDFFYKAGRDSSVPWTLKPRATVLLEPFDSSPAQAHRFAKAFDIALPVDPVNDELDTFDGFKSLEKTSLLIEKTYAELPNGAFIAEFATQTGVMCIRYKVPSHLIQPMDAPHHELECRFKGKLTAATIIPIDGLKMGNVHFDIEAEADMREIHRATLLVDFIENPFRVTSQLGDHIQQPARLARGSQMEPLPAATARIPVKYAFSATRPIIVVEAMSNPDPGGCGICIDGQTTQNSDGSWTIAGIIYKCYAQPH